MGFICFFRGVWREGAERGELGGGYARKFLSLPIHPRDVKDFPVPCEYFDGIVHPYHLILQDPVAAVGEVIYRRMH